jgi:hypothetical protein
LRGVRILSVDSEAALGIELAMCRLDTEGQARSASWTFGVARGQRLSEKRNALSLLAQGWMSSLDVEQETKSTEH